MIKIKALLLTIMLLNLSGLWAIEDYIKCVIGIAGTALTAGFIAVKIDRVYSERSLKNKERHIELEAKQSEQQQIQEKKMRQRASKDALKQASAQYGNNRSLKEEACQSGIPLFEVVQDASDHRKELIKAQSTLTGDHKEQCIRLIDIISAHIKDIPQHLIDQSAQEHQQRQEQKKSIEYQDQKRQEELKRLKALTDQEQAKLLLIHAQTAKECAQQRVYDSLPADIKALTRNQATLSDKVDQIINKTNSITHDVSRLSKMQSTVLHAVQGWLIMALSQYHTKAHLLLAYGVQKAHSVIEDNYYKHHADPYPGATAPEQP